MSDAFYRAFEDRYRGSRELIKDRLRVYLPFVDHLRITHKGAKAIDLGCGRGELLELLQQWGFDATGVDLDEGMLAACKALNLPVVVGDAISHLESVPDSSVALVSALHVAEHLNFTALKSLVRQALRVLQAGGLLILETPNPENLVVATKNFYMDPTHQRPIPPELLSFLPEFCGFHRVKTLRLQESKELASCEAPTLWDVLSGASPDFAVIAQKEPAPGPPFDQLEDLFRRDFGVNLETLAMRYETGVSGKLSEIISAVDRSAEHEARAKAAESTLAELQQQLEGLQQQVEHLRSRERALTNELASNNSLLEQTASQGAKWRAAYEAMVSSRSWRLMRPLRAIAGRIRRFFRAT